MERNFMRLSLKKGAHAVLSSTVQEIWGISLVFREMWNTAALHALVLNRLYPL